MEHGIFGVPDARADRGCAAVYLGGDPPHGGNDANHRKQKYDEKRPHRGVRK